MSLADELPRYEREAASAVERVWSEVDQLADVHRRAEHRSHARATAAPREMSPSTPRPPCDLSSRA